jgi:very-short-patch-repair endonuclease
MDKQHRQEFDIWVPAIKLVIEYDGRQHFEPVQFGGINLKRTIKNFERTKFLDYLKNKKVRQHKDDVRYFVRFDYKEKITEESVKNKIKSIVGEAI